MKNKTTLLENPFDEALLFLIQQEKDNLKENPIYQIQYCYLTDLLQRLRNKIYEKRKERIS